LFSNNLSNDILCAHDVFLSYWNLGYLIMRWYYILYFYKALHTFFFIFCWKLFMRLSGPEALDFFQSVQKANYHSHRPKLLMRPQRPWGRGCSYRSVGGGGARTGLLGEGRFIHSLPQLLCNFLPPR
jgi:hypothetical protein